MIKRYFAIIAAALCLFSCKENITEEPQRVILGDEQFEEYLPLLEGKRVAVYSNHSGIVGDKSEGLKVPAGAPVTEESVLVPFGTPAVEGGTVTYGPHILDALIEKGVNVTVIFSPEHGFRGVADGGESVMSSVDSITGLPIMSLFEGGDSYPTEEAMNMFDVVVMDVQDVGLRYYTYYITMHHLMEACVDYGKKLIVLDRPNPNGYYVDGPILDMQYKSTIGWLPIPTVHGMTIGELALMINGEGWLKDGAKCDLAVIPCKNYTHKTMYTLLQRPSPNLKNMMAIYLYSSTCSIEWTVVTAGRGTYQPFAIFGHPDLKGYDFSFTPRSIPGAKHPRYLDQLCYGRDLLKEPLDKVLKQGVSFEYIIECYNNLGLGDKFFNPNMEWSVGSSIIREMINAGATAEEVHAAFQGDVEKFKIQRKPYLIYPE